MQKAHIGMLVFIILAVIGLSAYWGHRAIVYSDLQMQMYRHRAACQYIQEFVGSRAFEPRITDQLVDGRRGKFDPDPVRSIRTKRIDYMQDLMTQMCWDKQVEIVNG